MFALETINTLHREPEWIRLNTDGSLANDIDIAEAGACSNMFSFHSQIGKYRTVFDGEVAAIRLTLTQLYCHLKNFTRAVIFCNSNAMILAINSNTNSTSPDILECKNLLRGAVRSLKTCWVVVDSRTLRCCWWRVSSLPWQEGCFYISTIKKFYSF